MKQKLLIITVGLLLLCQTIFAANKEINGTLGTSYADNPSKYGLDISLHYNWLLDPYFLTGLESGFFWVQWDRKIGVKQEGSVYVDVKADSNAYTIPIMFNAQVRLPNLQSKLYVVPFATVGFGYSFMILHYSRPDFTDSRTGKTYDSDSITKLFKGLSWELLFGVSLKPATDSKVDFYAECGYRKLPLKSGDLELDMSGFLLRFGVRYPL